MNSPRSAFARRKSSGQIVIAWAGLACGAMDITAALVVYGVLYGVRPVRLLQGIAAGLLGAAAYKQGLPTAVLGLLLHFLIAFMAAAVYFAFSRALPFMVRHAVPSGVLYGVAVYIFMQAVVLPLSAATRYGFSWKLTSIGVVIHILCVGLPIALVVRKYSVRS